MVINMSMAVVNALWIFFVPKMWGISSPARDKCLEWNEIR